MSHHENTEQAHSPHWSGEQGDEWIETGKDTIHISAKSMHITWENDDRFWRWINLSKQESRFEVGAELVQVKWLELSGSLDLAKFKLTPSTTYEILYIIKFKVDAFGWHDAPLKLEVITPDGNIRTRTEIFEQYVQKGNQEWLEINGGEFSLDSSMDGKLKFGMSEVVSDWWKGGMILEGVVIRPKMV